MYPITDAVKELFEADYRKVLRITGTDKNGTSIVITDNNILADSFMIDRYSCNGEKLEVGTAIAAQMSFDLDNIDGNYDDVVFEGTELLAEVGIADWDKASPVVSWVPCGRFTPDEQTRRMATIKITALDRMTKFDVVVDATDLTFPATIAGLVGQACAVCGVTLAQSISTLTNANVSVSALPSVESDITYRNLIQWCAGIMGANAWFDWNGQLCFSWYNNATGYVSTMDNRYSSDLFEYDLTITGVEYTNNNGIVIVEGTDDYAIDLTGNAIAEPRISTVLPPLNAALNGFTYRPFTAAVVNAPYLWPMDVVTFTDKSGCTHSSTLTNVVFGFSGTMALESKGMTYAINKASQPNGFTQQQAQLINAIAQVAIKAVDVEYAQNQSTTVAPTSGWSTDAPQWREGYYIWQRTATTTAGGTGYSEPTCISGRDGEDGSQGPQGPQGATGPQGPQGPQGVGIASVTEYYALNNSTTAPEDSAFSTGVKTPTASNRYVWNYELITYTDNSTSKTAKHIAATYGETGQAGATGNGISSVTDYYAVNNSTTAPADSAFSTTISLPTASNKYLWNYELITYTNGTTSKTGKRVIGTYGEKGNTGDQGQTGVGVSGVVEQYYLSTSSTTQTGGSWSTSQPQWASGKYIWTRSQVTWTNGTTTTTTPVLAQAINGANSTANAANSTANTANSTANAAMAAVTALDDALDQQEIFDRLTDNGAAQGLVLYNGQLYVNATYINTGYLSATRIQGGTLTLGGLNEARGDMTIVDESGNAVARIYSAGIAFADTSNLHGVKISRGGVVELSQISVYGSNAQFKAKILPLTSAGIAIADENGVSFASFGSGGSSIKSTFSVNDGSGGLLSVSGGKISLTDSAGSKLWMPGNGEVEVQASLNVTEAITVQQTGEAAVKAKCARSDGTRASIWLDSAPSGYHGLWSDGYYNGSAYTASGKWMIYRDTSGDVTLAGNATGNVAKTGDTMTGNLLVGTSNSGVERSVRAISDAGSIYLYAEGNSTGKRGIYTTNSNRSGKYVLVIDQDNDAVLTGRATGNVEKTGDTMTGNLTIDRTAGSHAALIVKNNTNGVSLWTYNNNSGVHGLYSDGYYNGSGFVSSGKWLINRDTSGNIIIPGNAVTRENLGTYLYLNNATPANVYAKLSALNSNETVNLSMSQAVSNYLTGAKVNYILTGQVRKTGDNEYRFMAYRLNGVNMYIWSATVTANGVFNVSGYTYSGTTM